MPTAPVVGGQSMVHSVTGRQRKQNDTCMHTQGSHRARCAQSQGRNGGKMTHACIRRVDKCWHACVTAYTCMPASQAQLRTGVAIPTQDRQTACGAPSQGHSAVTSAKSHMSLHTHACRHVKRYLHRIDRQHAAPRRRTAQRRRQGNDVRYHVVQGCVYTPLLIAAASTRPLVATAPARRSPVPRKV